MADNGSTIELVPSGEGATGTVSIYGGEPETGGINLVAAGAVDRALGELARDGQVGATGDLALDPDRRRALIRNDEMVERAQRYDAQSEDTQ